MDCAYATSDTQIWCHLYLSHMQRTDTDMQTPLMLGKTHMQSPTIICMMTSAALLSLQIDADVVEAKGILKYMRRCCLFFLCSCCCECDPNAQRDETRKARVKQ